jgi:hypothetical protein
MTICKQYNQSQENGQASEGRRHLGQGKVGLTEDFQRSSKATVCIQLSSRQQGRVNVNSDQAVKALIKLRVKSHLVVIPDRKAQLGHGFVRWDLHTVVGQLR